MKKLIALFAITALTATVGIVQARDLGPDEAQKLRDAGTIQSVEKLNAAALAKHQVRPLKKPILSRKKVVTCMSWTCATPKACNGTWSWMPLTARSSKIIKITDEMAHPL